MNYEDQANHVLGDIKKKLDSAPEEMRDYGYSLFYAYLCSYMAALQLGGEGFIRFKRAQSDITREMLEYIGKIKDENKDIYNN